MSKMQWSLRWKLAPGRLKGHTVFLSVLAFALLVGEFLAYAAPSEPAITHGTDKGAGDYYARISKELMTTPA